MLLVLLSCLQFIFTILPHTQNMVSYFTNRKPHWDIEAIICLNLNDTLNEHSKIVFIFFGKMSHVSH
jgi:hypothetical protein